MQFVAQRTFCLKGKYEHFNFLIYIKGPIDREKISKKVDFIPCGISRIKNSRGFFRHQNFPLSAGCGNLVTLASADVIYVYLVL